MTTSEDLRAQVAEDTERAREITRKRDEARARQDRLAPDDITPDGHLVRNATVYSITGWRTKDERENGTKHEAAHPAVVASLVSGLLEDGHYQVIVDSQPRPGTP